MWRRLKIDSATLTVELDTLTSTALPTDLLRKVVEVGSHFLFGSENCDPTVSRIFELCFIDCLEFFYQGVLAGVPTWGRFPDIEPAEGEGPTLRFNIKLKIYAA